MLQNVAVTLLLNLLFMFSTGKFVSSCIYKEVGNEVVIPFDGEKLQEDNDVFWKHNQRRVYSKRRSQVKISVLPVDDFSGSLILKNVQKNTSGEYMGEVFNKDGTLIKKTVQQLCVQEQVPEPTVLVECVEEGVNLTCSPMSNNDIVVSWIKNGIKAKDTSAILYISSSEFKSGDNFSCTVSNQISNKSSKEVKPACSDTGLHTTSASDVKENEVNTNSGNKEQEDDNENVNRLLFGFDLWWMLGILTGGGSFLLLLIICLVCVCSCYRRNKRKAKEEEEYRLTSLMPDHTNPPDAQYMEQTTSQRSSKSQRPLPPLPGPQDPPCVGPP